MVNMKETFKAGDKVRLTTERYYACAAVPGRREDVMFAYTVEYVPEEHGLLYLIETKGQAHMYEHVIKLKNRYTVIILGGENGLNQG